MMHAHTATQGHRYQYGETEVMAMESGVVVVVQEIDPSQPYPLTRKWTVKASWLQPLPLRYLHGGVPE